MLLFLPLCLISCGSDDEPSDSQSSLIIGSWKNISYLEVDKEGNLISTMSTSKDLLVIKKDGTATCGKMTFKWSVTDGKLKFVNIEDGGTDIYPIQSLTKEELVLKWGTVDGNYYVNTYNRVE